MFTSAVISCSRNYSNRFWFSVVYAHSAQIKLRFHKFSKLVIQHLPICRLYLAPIVNCSGMGQFGDGRFGDRCFGDEMWNVFSFGISPKWKSSHCRREIFLSSKISLWKVTKVQKFALPSSGKRVSARVSLALVPNLSNFAVFIAIHDAHHGFGSAITVYSYTHRQPLARKYDKLLD